MSKTILVTKQIPVIRLTQKKYGFIYFVLSNKNIFTDIEIKKIQTPINATMDLGKHNVRFNAENLASGIYTAQLTTGSLRCELKMMLNK